MLSLLIGSKTTGALSWRRWIELKLVSQSLATLYSIPPPFFSPHFGMAAAACAGGSHRRNCMHLFLACRGDRAELNPHRWQCKRGVLGPRECQPAGGPQWTLRILVKNAVVLSEFSLRTTQLRLIIEYIGVLSENSLRTVAFLARIR